MTSIANPTQESKAETERGESEGERVSVGSAGTKKEGKNRFTIHTHTKKKNHMASFRTR